MEIGGETVATGMIHYLLVYDHEAERLVSSQEFKDAGAATVAYSKAEQLHAYSNKLEIVLVGSDSIETIKRTHGHYFAARPETNRYLRAV